MMQFYLSFVAGVVSFQITTYKVNESDGVVQPRLKLSRPFSTDITVTVNAVGGNATGKQKKIMILYHIS